MHCPAGNATDLIWRVLTSSDGISFWTPLKPQHSNPNHLANQLWCIDFLTLPTPLIIPHRLPAFLESLMPLKNWSSIQARCSKSSLKHSIRFCDIFPSLKHNFIAYRSSKVSDCIFEIYQQWQSGFSRVYSNCCYSCSFEAKIIKIGQSSHKMYSNNILNSKCLYKKSLKTYWMHHIYQLVHIINDRIAYIWINIYSAFFSLLVFFLFLSSLYLFFSSSLHVLSLLQFLFSFTLFSLHFLPQFSFFFFLFNWVRIEVAITLLWDKLDK